MEAILREQQQHERRKIISDLIERTGERVPASVKPDVYRVRHCSLHNQKKS
jgi:hypothetical protein